MNNILIVLGGIAAGCVLLWFLWRQYIFHQASKMAQKVFPVWAGQGPFENGAESARAMKAAYTAVMGPEKAAEAQDSIKKHQIVYDQDPQTWENLRKESLQASREINDFITVAEGIAAMDSINEDILEGGGHRLEVVTNEKGAMDFVYKQIWSDEEIEKHKEETNDAILIGLGESVLKSETPEGKELLGFLVELYSVAHERDPETAKDIGTIFINCISACNDDSEDEICIEFNRLYNAYSLEDEEQENND